VLFLNTFENISNRRRFKNLHLFVVGYFDSKRKANPFACLDHTLSCSEHIFLIGDGFDPV